MTEPWKEYQQTEDGPWNEYNQYKRRAEGIGTDILQGVGTVASTIDRFTGAPVRAAIGAYQEDKPVLEAFGNQFLAPAYTAPTGKEIVSRMGLSEEEFDTPLVKDPRTLEKYKASTAGLVGGLAEAVLDPTSYIPGAAVAKGLGLAKNPLARGATRAVGLAEETAEKRAAKAATGQNKRALQEIQAGPGGIRGFGRKLLNTKVTGKDGKTRNLIGWADDVDNIAKKAEAKLDEVGPEFGAVLKQVDETNPEAFDTDALALKIIEEADTKYWQPANKGIRDKMYEQADELLKLGKMSASRGQQIKNSYAFKRKKGPPGPNELDPVLKNRLKALSGKQLNEAVASTGDPALTQRWGKAMDDYGPITKTAALAEERAIADLSNRWVSPSDYAMGAVGMLTSPTQLIGGLKGAALAFANKQVRSRGNAFVARSMDALSRKIGRTPALYNKVLPKLQAGAVATPAALVTAHHELMNNDPDYRASFLADQEP